VAPHLELAQLQAMPITPYADLRRELRTGDLLFASGKYAVSDLIRQVTHSPWTHVGIVLQLPVLERVLLLESVESVGVRMIPLSKYLEDFKDQKPYDGFLVVARVAGVTSEGAKKLMQFGADELGRPYNKEEIEALMDPESLRKGKIVARDRTYVCSDLVRACFRNAGIQFHDGPAGLISPENLWTDERVTLLARIL
jgi:uncharacterized protein YycO